ncbi:MAG: rhodanese-like domain-containing protein [Aggregatilineaceae bacterium]
MRKFTLFALILALVLPLALPFAPVAAQENIVEARLQAYNASLPPAYGNVSVDDLAVEMIEKPDLLIVDVRQPEEYAESHLPGAINIPLRDLARNLDALPDLNAPIVVYCGTAFRSSIAMTALQVLGYTNVRSMKGGFNAWTAEEYTTTTDVFEAQRSTAPEIDPELLSAVDAALSGIPQGWGAIKAEDLNIKLIENPPDLLIDVRKVEEVTEQGTIAGSVNWPLEQFMSFVGELPENRDADIVVYCGVGHRGNMAATMLRILGYTNILNLAGGFGAWSTAGLPIEGAAPAATAETFDLAGLLDSYISGLPASFNAIRAADLNALLAENPDILLVDVRTADEFEEGHLAGAINIPLIELTDHLNLLPDLNQKMVIYCGSGHRSAIAMVLLNLLGYQNAQSLLGGTKAWLAAELPVTTEVVEAKEGTAPAFNPDLLAAIDTYVKTIPAGFYAISADDLNVALIENPPYLIDVRTDEEVAKGIIEGAAHIELRSFVGQMDQWPADKSQPVVVYCGSGHRSAIAMIAMQLLGYTDVRSLAGGVGAWTAKEYPLAVPAMAN